MASEIHHPVFARFMSGLAALEERMERGKLWRELFEGMSGKVVDVGPGNGIVFRHYPEDVTEVLAVEPEDYMREQAERAAADAPVPVRVVAGLAENIPAEDGSFDAAVTGRVLCSVPDQDTALAEIRRVLRPGGELRFYEHVVARRPGLARTQDTADRAFWTRAMGGCHTARDTTSAIERAGFTIERCRRFSNPPGLFAAPSVLGVARRR